MPQTSAQPSESWDCLRSALSSFARSPLSNQKGVSRYGIPLRPPRKPVWRSAGAHSRCRLRCAHRSPSPITRTALSLTLPPTPLPPITISPLTSPATGVFSCHSLHAQAHSTTLPWSSVSASARRAQRAAVRPVAASGCTCPHDAHCAGLSPPPPPRPPVLPVPPRRLVIPPRCPWVRCSARRRSTSSSSEGRRTSRTRVRWHALERLEWSVEWKGG